jgi:uncharacterized protein YwqG
VPSFHQLADTHGFADHVGLLRRYVMPCIGFSWKPTRDCAAGNSRLGGGPDLPPSFDWPTNKGRPLDYLLHVNLADAARLDEADTFPRSGC